MPAKEPYWLYGVTNPIERERRAVVNALWIHGTAMTDEEITGAQKRLAELSSPSTDAQMVFSFAS